MCDISVRVCVSGPGQLFLLTTPHVLGPTMIRSLSGNLQYGGKIKRRHWWDWWGGGGDGQVDRAHGGRRVPLRGELDVGSLVTGTESGLHLLGLPAAGTGGAPTSCPLIWAPR